MKSQTEIKFDEVSKSYYKKFGERYPLNITDMRTLDEHIRIMENCLIKGVPEKYPEQDGEIY